jgi:MFS family permease
MRPLFGLVADKLGIGKTIIALDLVLTLGGVSLFMGLISLSTLLIGLSGGSIITLYFNVAGEIFGTKFSTVNSGILYTGKAIGGVLGSLVYNYLYFGNPLISSLYVTLAGVASGLLTLSVYLKEIVKPRI